MKAFNIIWDVDDERDLQFLPTEIDIPDGMEDDDEISDYISEVTGFCHKGYSLSDENEWEFYQMSPAGEDFGVCLYDEDDIVSAVRKYADDFDGDEHVEELIEAKRNGFRGVPSVSILVHDAEAIQEMLDELAYALEQLEDDESEDEDDAV